MHTTSTTRGPLALARDALWTGTIAGLAMIPFAAVFRARGLRINEYGRKTLALVVGEVSPTMHTVLTFLQHLIISWVVAVPLLLVLRGVSARSTRVAVGALYGALFYVTVNALALPWAFGDPTPWTLGFDTVYPSLVVHLVYGMGVALSAAGTAARSSSATGPCRP